MQTVSPNDPTASFPSPPNVEESFYRAHRLLVVDDDHSVRKAMADILAHCGYECDQASCAAEALLYLEKQPYTCVLTDLIMPEKSGMDLLREIMTSYPEIAVILVSGQNDSSMVRKALKNGAFDYIVKPVTAGEIAKTFGIRVYTIGVGRNGTAPYPIKTPFGTQYQNMPIQKAMRAFGNQHADSQTRP